MAILNNQVSTVASMGDALTFVCDSQDAQAVRESIGGIANDYDSFFVNITDGDYAEVWGMVGSVPYMSKLVTRIR